MRTQRINDGRPVAPMPRWGTAGRRLPALAIRQTVAASVPGSLQLAMLLDRGCGNGGIASALAQVTCPY